MRVSDILSSSFKPPAKESVRRKFDENEHLYKQLVEEVQYILSKGTESKKVRITSIDPRVKEFDSFYNKIIRKEITGDPFELIEDIAGVRVICYYRTDLERIEELIRNKFAVIKAEVLRNRTDMTFGYMSDQYVVKLPKHFRGERYDAIKSLKCEIQVRTVSMHAWATVSHHLDYKQAVDIPSGLKNDFYALSGVFYIADSLFEQFRNARETSLRKLTREVETDQFNLDSEMNLDTLKAYLLWKFPEREYGETEQSARFLSILSEELNRAGFSNFQKLDETLDNNMGWFKKYEKKHHPIDTKDNKFYGIGVVRIILSEHLAKQKLSE